MPIGPWELAIILVIVIIIFGAGKLPEIGGALGRGIREFKESARDEDDDEQENEQQPQQQQYGQQQYAQQPQAPPPADQQPQYHADPNASQQQGQSSDQPGGSGEPVRRDA